MIKSRFYTIFDIVVTHTYYKDGICKGLVYMPTKATKEIMDTYAIKQRTTNTGFGLFTDAKSGIEVLLNYITEVTGETSFHFVANTSDAQYYQFTNVPVDKIGVTVYKSDVLQESKTPEILVLRPDFISTEEANMVFKVVINFEDILTLYDKNSSPVYEINLKARATQWRYLIINNHHQNLGKLTIEGKSGVTFEDPIDVTLQNGEKATLFSSGDQLLKLTEIPKYSFDLLNTTTINGMNRTKTIYKGLPNPNPSVIEINTSQDKPSVASLMYIYV